MVDRECVPIILNQPSGSYGQKKNAISKRGAYASLLLYFRQLVSSSLSPLITQGIIFNGQ